MMLMIKILPLALKKPCNLILKIPTLYPHKHLTTNQLLLYLDLKKTVPIPLKAAFSAIFNMNIFKPAIKNFRIS